MVSKYDVRNKTCLGLMESHYLLYIKYCLTENMNITQQGLYDIKQLISGMVKLFQISSLVNAHLS